MMNKTKNLLSTHGETTLMVNLDLEILMK